MKRKIKLFFWTALLLAFTYNNSMAQELTPTETVGELIFFDENLSLNQNQSCASCHDPEVGWTGPDQQVNSHGAIYEGSVLGLFGNRKPPSSGYATNSPVFKYVRRGGGEFVGGNFWDGRATGEKLGNPAADQAQGPFLNPLEQALPDAACVVERVCNSPYGGLFQQVFPSACAINFPANIDTICSQPMAIVDLSDEDRNRVEMDYNDIALAIAAYENSSTVNQFSSKFDAFRAGLVELTPEEERGRQLFQGKAQCARCHTTTPGPNGEPPVFTDFTFANLGLPKNPENPFYVMPLVFNPLGTNWLDIGLGGFLQTRIEFEHLAPANFGKQKVPTLRNVDKRPFEGFVKAYGHNGVFKSLKQIVHFYNTRDVLPICPDDFQGIIGETCWPAAEIPANINTPELGDLRLSDEEEDAVVAFMTTLSDGFMSTTPPIGEFDIELELDVPSKINSGQSKRIKVELKNEGPDTALGGEVNVIAINSSGLQIAQFTSSFESLDNNSEIDFRFRWIAPDGADTITWTATVIAHGDTNLENNMEMKTSKVRSR